MTGCYRVTCVLLLAGWLTLHNIYAFGQGETAFDQRVQAALQEASIKFRQLREGEFEATIPIKGSRKQQVIIHSNIVNWGGAEYRITHSTGYLSPSPPSSELMRRLLTENAVTGVGKWQLEERGRDHAAVFVFPVPANCDGGTLRRFLMSAALTADNVEREASGRDDF